MKTFKIKFYKTQTLNPGSSREEQVADYSQLVEIVEISAKNEELALDKAYQLETILQQKHTFSLIASTF